MADCCVDCVELSIQILGCVECLIPWYEAMKEEELLKETTIDYANISL